MTGAPHEPPRPGSWNDELFRVWGRRISPTRRCDSMHFIISRSRYRWKFRPAVKRAKWNRKRAEVPLEKLKLRWRVPPVRALMYWTLFLSMALARLLDTLVYYLVCPVFNADGTNEALGPVCKSWGRESFMLTTALSISVLLADFIVRVIRILWPPKPSADHWVAAASKEFFEENARGVISLQDTMCSWICIGGMLTSTARFVSRAPPAYSCIFG
eukprot:scaffold383254_cov45-Prasinocladus_malaysianus.AAC.1